MKKIGIFILMIVLVGSVLPVSARSSLDALYVSATDISVPDSLTQIVLPQSAKDWRTSWKAREEFFGLLTKQTPVKFVYETEKVRVSSDASSLKSTYVGTLRCPFDGWLYQDNEKGFDYILMFRKDWDMLEKSCKTGILDGLAGYFISSQTFKVESGAKKGTEFFKEGNRLDRRFYEVKGKNYTLVTLVQPNRSKSKK